MIKLVYSILGQAVNEGASDIHFEPDEGDMRVRFRVDGVLHEAARVPKRMVAGVVSRVKIMSELDIAEKRVPQDGRVERQRRGPQGRPARDHPADPARRGRDDPHPRQGARRCGRSTSSAWTARAASASRPPSPSPTARSWSPGRPARASRPRCTRRSASSTPSSKNIITIEDPVEYRISGINQINVNRKAGLDFATGLRSILRADPDVIMVGEIRDAETARIAIEAALTGHMVLTTLHTNDAPGRGHAAGEDGDRELPDRVGGRLRGRPAPGAPALHRLQAAHRDPAGRAARGGLPGRRRPRGLRAGRLRALQPAPATGAGSASSR